MVSNSSSPVFRRAICAVIERRLAEPRRFLQVLSGPRQAGKTTLVRQALAASPLPGHYASADDPGLRDRAWIDQQWEVGRHLTRAAGAGGAVLALDEIHKIGGWSEVVKRLWDEDTMAGSGLRVVLLGSAPLLMGRGLSDSLAGRFELVRVPHWSFAEMRAAFGWELADYIYFGGYPGAAPLVAERDRWAAYVVDSLIETTIARDVLLLARVDKPALLRQLFHLACRYSGQVLSYQKMVGQLQDAGNTTTLAHYLELLGAAGMVTGLPKYSGETLRQRATSPKLQVLNTALMTAQTTLSPADFRRDPALWGHRGESAVGAHLLNDLAGTPVEVSYWRDRGREVDFVLRAGSALTAIEVKSGRPRQAPPGLSAFAAQHGPVRSLLVGGGGIPLEDFLLAPARSWVA
jgi:uncharacterized protein